MAPNLRRVKRQLFAEFVLLKGYGLSLDDYSRLSLYDRYHLHRAVQKHREAIHGTAEEDDSPLNPEME